MEDEERYLPATASATHLRLIILCGLPGAGKTTFARRLESALPIVRLCPDEWMADSGIDYRDEVARDHLEARLTRLALSLLGLGQSVLLEYGFWGRSERDQNAPRPMRSTSPLISTFSIPR